MIIFLAENALVRGALQHVLITVGLPHLLLERPPSSPADACWVFAVGPISHESVLKLVAKGIVVLDVTLNLLRAISVGQTHRPILGRDNLTLVAASRFLHDLPKDHPLTPASLGAALDQVVRPLARLGYLTETHSNALEEAASLPKWSPTFAQVVHKMVRSQFEYVNRLAMDPTP